MKFNKKDFQIIKHSQEDEIGHINDDRALALMKLGYIHHNDKENWWKNGYKSTKKGTELYHKWLDEIRQKHNHIWLKNKDSEDYGDNSRSDTGYGEQPDSFAYSEGYHNGYKCKKCGFEFCHHCTTEWDVPKCSKETKDITMSSNKNIRFPI